MNKKLSVLVSLCFFIILSFVPLNGQWARTYGGSDDDYACSIQQTSDGGYIIAGYTYSFGAGDCDIWLLKVDSIGDVEWQKTYGGIDTDSTSSEPDAIQETSDGGFIVTGWTYSYGSGLTESWVLKLDSNGNIIWQKTYGGSSYDTPRSIRQTVDGGYIVAGFTRSSGAGSNDYWILKLSSTGNIEWQKTYGGSDAEHANSIRQTADGGYIVVGNTYSFGAGSDDIWVLKLYSTGNIEWQKTYGASGSDYAYCVQQTIDGGYIIAGDTTSFGAGSVDIWILKLSSTGNIEWQKTYGGAGTDCPWSIQQTSDEGYIISSWTYSFGVQMDDGWILKLSSNGNIEWEKTYGGSSYDSARFVLEVDDGSYIAAGFTDSYTAGGADICVLKIYQDGNIDPSCDFVGDSFATVYDTSVNYNYTGVTPTDTSVSPVSTYCSPLNTYATESIFCEAPKFYLTISATSGGTTDPPPDTYTYYNGIEAEIEAIPDTSNFRFDGWTGDVPPGHENDNPLSVTMDSDKSIQANFIRQYTLTISSSNGGTTNPVPGNYTYDSGAYVSVQAIPNSGYNFTGWSGDVTGTTNPISITMNGDKSITANFSAPTGNGGDDEKSSAQGGGCFIATAAYGSPLHPHVDILRNFRDKYLMSNKLGREWVDLYYKYSPFVAKIIAKHKALKILAQIHLWPLVAFCYATVHFKAIVTAGIFIFLSVFSVMLIINRNT